jgi:hypothetical protein
MAQESQQGKVARETAEEAANVHRVSWPADGFGTPMIRISAHSQELIPTVQFGNALIGVSVERFAPDGPDSVIKAEMKRTMALCEEAVAEDRQTLHEQIRARAGQ